MTAIGGDLAQGHILAAETEETGTVAARLLPVAETVPAIAMSGTGSANTADTPRTPGMRPADAMSLHVGTDAVSFCLLMCLGPARGRGDEERRGRSGSRDAHSQRGGDHQQLKNNEE